MVGEGKKSEESGICQFTYQLNSCINKVEEKYWGKKGVGNVG